MNSWERRFSAVDLCRKGIAFCQGNNQKIFLKICFLVLISSLKFPKTAHAWTNNVNGSSVVTDWGQITQWVPRNDSCTSSAVTFLLDYLAQGDCGGGGMDKGNGFRGAAPLRPPQLRRATWLCGIIFSSNYFSISAYYFISAFSMLKTWFRFSLQF